MRGELSKYQAEHALGLSGTYDQDGLKQAYHAAVKRNHPDVGGSQDDMIRVNVAYEKLSVFFVNEPKKVVTCDDKDYNIGNARSRTTTHTYSTGTSSNSSQSNNYDDDPIKSAREAAERMQAEYKAYAAYSEAKRRARERAERQRARTSSGSSSSDARQFNSFGEVISYYLFGGKYRRPAIKDAPLWWRFLNFMASWFPWRTAIWLSTIVYAGYVSLSPENVLLIKWIVLQLAIVASVVNIFGVITNPLRRLIRRRIDKTLEDRAEKQGKRVDWRARKIVSR